MSQHQVTNLVRLYRASSRKQIAAGRLWYNEPLVGLNTTGWAHKTENFARAILGDPHAVVLDTWMLRTMGVTIKDVKHRYQYDGIARRVCMAAALVGERTSEFQAIVWLKVRSE